MTSRLVVNNLEPDSGVSTVTVNGNVEATKFVGPLEGAATELSTNATGANLTLTGNLGVGGTITYEDVARVDATGISTFREGFGVGPLTGIALTAYSDGSIRTSGIVTASSFVGSGANLTGLPASSEWNFENTGISTTKNIGIATDSVTTTDLVGAGNSFVGAYIGDGFLAFNKELNRASGYYITTAINALNAGPVTLGSTMTLAGTWVIV